MWDQGLGTLLSRAIKINQGIDLEFTFGTRNSYMIFLGFCERSRSRIDQGIGLGFTFGTRNSYMVFVCNCGFRGASLGQQLP
eukprot:1160720-Pelagomonas_calceolata.AAC.5